MIHIVLIIIFIAAWLLRYPRRSTRSVGFRTQRTAWTLIRQWDDVAMEEFGDEPVDNQQVRVVAPRIARQAAAYVRTKIALPSECEANRLVVTRLVQEFLRERGVRPTHQLAILPLAASLSFVPTAFDVEARDLEATAAFRRRKDVYAADRRGGVWGWLCGRGRSRAD